MKKTRYRGVSTCPRSQVLNSKAGIWTQVWWPQSLQGLIQLKKELKWTMWLLKGRGKRVGLGNSMCKHAEARRNNTIEIRALCYNSPSQAQEIIQLLSQIKGGSSIYLTPRRSSPEFQAGIPSSSRLGYCSPANGLPYSLMASIEGWGWRTRTCLGHVRDPGCFMDTPVPTGIFFPRLTPPPSSFKQNKG